MKVRDILVVQQREEFSPVVSALPVQLEPTPWPCRHCGQPAEIEAVEPRKDDGVLLTFWRCLPCQTWAVTPSTRREPPVWVSRAKQ
jgi:hypothetical protein